MARNVQFQVLRGSQANLQSAMPLAIGEMYFATDTGNLFMGLPGLGLGYMQIGDVTDLQDEVCVLRSRVEALELALLNLGIDAKEFADAT